MPRFVAIPLVLVLGCGLSPAQQAPAIAAQPNTVYIAADGRYEAPPDTALIQFNIAAQEDTAKAAYDRAARAADQIRQLLRGNGIDPKSAEIGFFSLAPVYDWRQPKRKLLGYRVSTSATLKLKDFSKVAPVVQQLAEIDVTENQMLNYILEDIEAAKIRAVEDAFRRARGEAEAIAKAGGRTLGELYYTSVDTVERVPVFAPAPRMAMSAGKAAEIAPPTAEFTPHTIQVTAHVNAIFAMK
jgi:uncharacterized protein YggE